MKTSPFRNTNGNNQFQKHSIESQILENLTLLRLLKELGLSIGKKLLQCFYIVQFIIYRDCCFWVLSWYELEKLFHLQGC